MMSSSFLCRFEASHHPGRSEPHGAPGAWAVPGGLRPGCGAPVSGDLRRDHRLGLPGAGGAGTPQGKRDGHCFENTGVGKCPFLGNLNITFKYLLDIISPIVGWCSIRTFTNPWNKVIISYWLFVASLQIVKTSLVGFGLNFATDQTLFRHCFRDSSDLHLFGTWQSRLWDIRAMIFQRFDGLIWRFPESWGYPTWMVYFMETPIKSGWFRVALF